MSIIKFCDSKFPSSSTLRCSKFLRLALCSTTAFVAVEPALTLLSAWRSSNSKPIANRKKSQGLIALPSTTLYYKACTKHFAALLCTTYKVCTNYFPVLLCTTRLAQSTSQYYFELQSLHKALPSTTVYYKACKKYFPVLCTTKLGQSTFQYYFVLQSLHKPRPSTTLYYTKLAPSTTLYYKACTNYFLVYITLYYEACAKHFPVLLCDTKLVQRKLLHTASSLTVEAFTHSKLFKQGSFYTQKLLHAEKLLLTASFHTQQAFTHSKRLHTEHLHTEKLLHTASFYRKKFLHREAFLYIITTKIAAPKPDLDAKPKKDDFEVLFKWFYKENY